MRCREHKGSYSFYTANSNVTEAKIIIFQHQVGKIWGDDETLDGDGVYVLVRVGGALGPDRRIWERTKPSRTMSIAPHHSENFGYFRLPDHVDLNEIAKELEELSASQGDPQPSDRSAKLPPIAPIAEKEVTKQVA